MISENSEIIPISNPFIGDAEKKYVSECLDAGWVSHRSPVVGQFEDACFELGGMGRVAVSNGTVAIEILLRAAGVQPGDEVITSGLTYAATANAILSLGAIPRIADIDSRTWQIDPKSAESLITQRTRAILAVHLYGNVAPIHDLEVLASGNGLVLLFDSAEAHGALFNSKPIGDFGLGSTTSFYANKIVTTGEGGMVMCNSVELEARIRHLINHAQVSKREFVHDQVGWNYRLSALCAAFGLGQIARLQRTLDVHRNIENLYRQHFDGLTNTGRLQWMEETTNAKSVTWLTTALLNDPKKSVSDARAFLLQNGIETRPFFVPLTSMSYIGSNEDTPISNDIAKRGICLPTFQTITEPQIIKVVKLLNQFMDS
jgi:perosamine synthetase